MITIQEAYDKGADDWHRDQPQIISDVLARLPVFRWLEQHLLEGKVLDMGCGEGYFSRQIASETRTVVGVDFSRSMLKLARERESRKRQGIEYVFGDISVGLPERLQDKSFDCVVANLVAHYFCPSELVTFYKAISSALSDGGHFVISIPHPCFAVEGDYSQDGKVGGWPYIQARGHLEWSTMEKQDGGEVKVGYCHSTLSDHFESLRKAELYVTEILEPYATTDDVRLYPMLAGLQDQTLYLIVVGKRTPRDALWQSDNPKFRMKT